MSSNKLSIINYDAKLAKKFKEINEEWITEMFSLESKDKKVLENPDSIIIATGGHILFVKVEGLGIVGTGALLKTGEDEYELTKMGVLKSARGHHAGELLLQSLIAKAKEIKAKKLYLLTNSKCEAAIHLYLKNGFTHDKEIMCSFGCEYGRCNVAMRYSTI